MERLKDSSSKLQKEGEKMWSYLIDVGGKVCTVLGRFVLCYEGLYCVRKVCTVLGRFVLC